MLDTVFSSVLSSTDSVAAQITTSSYLLCTLASIILGAACACIYMFKHNYSKNFVVTLALLPIIVQMVILLVNGNLGAGIAVMGVFNLVRFRSIPGSAKDIGSVFLAMAVGLATGMGFISLAVLFTVIMAIMNIVYVLTPFGDKGGAQKLLKITVPEDMNFDGVFDEVLDRYTISHELALIKTASMGSLYQLEYKVRVKEPGTEKTMIDELRCLNGNLKIALGLIPAKKETL